MGGSLHLDCNPTTTVPEHSEGEGEEVSTMRGHRLVVTLLAAFSMAAMLLSGLLVLPPRSGDEVAAPDSAGQPVETSQAVSEEDLVLLGRRRPGHEGIKARMGWFVLGGTVIAADINPTLAGNRSYKVVLKVKHQGEWVRCGAMRTRNVMVEEYVPELAWFTRGPRPHEAAIFADLYGPFDTIKCPGNPKGAKKYRIVLPKQHGFERTISRVFRIQQ